MNSRVADRDSLADVVIDPGPKAIVSGKRVACSSDSAIVTNTILRVLENGGNAVDAAVAGSLVQATVEPFMTNHSGTVTFLYWEAETRRTYQLESTGTFPHDLPPFRPVPGGIGNFSLPGTQGPAACIPGFMPGLKAIYERFGTKPWTELCDDAIYWAEDGYPVSSFEYGVNVWGMPFIVYFSEGRQFYLPTGHQVPVGQRKRNPELAETLKQLAADGPDYFIEGGWANAFVKMANDLGWPITMAHMNAVPPRWIEPLVFDYGDYQISGLAPPERGALFNCLVLGTLHYLGIEGLEPGSSQALYYLAHTLRKAHIELGVLHDPKIFKVPVDEWTDPELHKLWAKIIEKSQPKVDLTNHLRQTIGNHGLSHANAIDYMQRKGADQPVGSCELTIVDGDGNWVQMMNTLQSGGIPGKVVGGVPMVGSHAFMGDLDRHMSVWLAEGARVRLPISNTIIFKEDKPWLSTGTPGSPHCTVAQVLNNILNHKMTPYDAVDAPRMNIMENNCVLNIESRLSREAIDGLTARGIRIDANVPYDFHLGSFQMCWREEHTGLLSACTDPRRCGVADGLD